jgi:hypothetical protein
VEPVFGKDHAQSKNSERDDDSKKNHPALEVWWADAARDGRAVRRHADDARDHSVDSNAVDLRADDAELVG